MISSRFLLGLLTSVFLLSCQEEKSIYNEKDFIGEWNCVELYLGDELQPLMEGTIHFDFSSDSMYTYQGGLHKESGKWWLKGHYLVTHADGGLEKRVEIESLALPHLTLLMNDRGSMMKMKLELVE